MGARPTAQTDPSLVTEFVCDHCGTPFLVYTSQIPKKPRASVYCSQACKAAGQQRTSYTDADIERFWSKVNVGHTDECWEWQGADRPSGYGKIWWPGHSSVVSTHRIAFLLANGREAESDVRHTCDNPPCCNPDHLIEGTKAQNMRDAVERRRIAFGERNGQAILTEDQVREIRARYHPGDPVNGGAALAREFGVSPGTVYAVIKGKNWKHVPA